MLKCHNDGKEKSQSFEVWDDSEITNSIDKGYGKDLDSAVAAYIKNVDAHIYELVAHRSGLEYSKVVMVDFMGKPIN